MADKPCPVCGTTTDADFDLRTYPSGNTTRKVRCRKCERERKKRFNRQRSVAGRSHAWHVEHEYGLTGPAYELILKSQNGVCKICNQPHEMGRRLEVDHCHKTGIIRGLLCGRCNKLLGLSDDNPSILRQAIVHLEQASNGTGPDPNSPPAG